MSLTFIELMQKVADDDNMKKDIRDNLFKIKQSELKDKLFSNLTTKYFGYITEAIKYASLNGKTYKYINFNRNDFIVDFPGLRNPTQNQDEWLQELCNPESKYLKYNIKSYDQRTNLECKSLQGLQYNIWNNRSYTTVFNWGSGPNLKRDGT